MIRQTVISPKCPPTKATHNETAESNPPIMIRFWWYGQDFFGDQSFVASEAFPLRFLRPIEQNIVRPKQGYQLELKWALIFGLWVFFKFFFFGFVLFSRFTRLVTMKNLNLKPLYYPI